MLSLLYSCGNDGGSERSDGPHGPSSSGRELTLPQLSGSRAPKIGVKTWVPASGPGFPIQSL